MFKVIRSNTQIAVIPLRFAGFYSDLVQSFIRSQANGDTLQMFKVKDQG